MKKEIDNAIRNYQMYVREVNRLEDTLYSGGTSARSWGVATYGIEAAMPRGSGGLSNAELDALDRREQITLKRMQKYQSVMDALHKDLEESTNEFEHIVFDCLLDGMTYREIGNHLRVSREKIRRTKEEIVCRLCQNSHICTYLTYQKSVS